MSEKYKYILQKDVPERMALSHFRLNSMRNDISLINIAYIFNGKSHSKCLGFWYSIKFYWLDDLQKGYRYRDIDYSIDDYRKYYTDSNRFLYDVQIDESTFTYIGEKKRLR